MDYKDYMKCKSICFKNGVFVYPIYFKNQTTIKDIVFDSNSWYIQVDNNGLKKTYPKKIGKGGVLTICPKGSYYNYEKAIKETYKFWREKIIKKISDGAN